MIGRVHIFTTIRVSFGQMFFLSSRRQFQIFAGLVVLNICVLAYILSLQSYHFEDMTSLAIRRLNIYSTLKNKASDRQIRDVIETNTSAETEYRRTCWNKTFLENKTLEDSWIWIDNNRSACVFSAYLVNATKIVVISAVQDFRQLIVFGVVWFEASIEGMGFCKVVDCSVELLGEDHGRSYSASFFECTLPVTAGRPRYISVAISTDKWMYPKNLIPVQPTSSPLGHTRRFTVCLTPLNNNYNNINELIEWIELNKLLGAEKFTIYNYSSSVSVTRVLEFYEKSGTVDVVQWNIPLKVETWPITADPEIHYFGQLAALHDCLYRNKAHSQYIVNEDLDEFIIPKPDNITTWLDLLETLPQRGTFMFKNAFFRKEWPDDQTKFQNKEIAEKYRLVTLLKNKREDPFPFGNRSKYIARTAVVKRLHVHTVFFPSRHGGIKLVSPNLALLHHYRHWQTEIELQNHWISDDTVNKKYGTRLTRNVAKVLKDMQILNDER